MHNCSAGVFNKAALAYALATVQRSSGRQSVLFLGAYMVWGGVVPVICGVEFGPCKWCVRVVSVCVCVGVGMDGLCPYTPSLPGPPVCASRVPPVCSCREVVCAVLFFWLCALPVSAVSFKRRSAFAFLWGGGSPHTPPVWRMCGVASVSVSGVCCIVQQGQVDTPQATTPHSHSYTALGWIGFCQSYIMS